MGSEIWIHGNDWVDENIHGDDGVRVVLYSDYRALEAEREALLDTIFGATADLEEGHYAEARAKLTQALTKGGGDE